MKSKHLKISIDEFHDMEHPFGWKAEYYDGMAHFRPRHHNLITKAQVCKRQVKGDLDLRPIDINFRDKMVDIFFETFQESVEFCDWEIDQIKKHAEKNINDYFNERRGKPYLNSLMAIGKDGINIVGLGLFLTNEDGNMELDLLFIKPNYQRKGLGTELVSTVNNKLCEEGITELYSAYHICNEGSKSWHHSFGFKDICDQLFINSKFNWFRFEIQRRKKLGQTDGIDELIEEKNWWYSKLNEQ
jgi:N-acetylglutamate synthase-like GNAT family acetyltransferase